METKQLLPVESKTLIEKAMNWFGGIKQLTITNDQQNENAMTLCKEVKTTYNALEKARKSIVEPWGKDVKEVNAEFKLITSKLKNFEDVSKRATAIYLNEQERLRKKKQQELDNQAAEVTRKANIAAQKERDKEEEYRKDGKDELADKAATRAETKETIATQTVAPIIPEKKVAGVSTRKVWKINEDKTDMAKAIKACLENEMLHQFILLDFKAIAKMCNANSSMKIDGISYYEDSVTSVRA